MSAGPWKRHSQSPRHCSWLWPRTLRPAGCKQRRRVQLPEGPQFCILLHGPQTKNGSPAGQTKVIHRREAERERRSLCPWRAAGSTDIIVAWDPLSFNYNIKEMEIFVSAMVTKVSLLHPAKPTFSIILYMKESISGIKDLAWKKIQGTFIALKSPSAGCLINPLPPSTLRGHFSAFRSSCITFC